MITTLLPAVRDLFGLDGSFRHGPFLPGGRRLSMAIEHVIPRCLPVGGFPAFVLQRAG